MNVLGQPLRLPCGAELSNRIAKAAMTEGLADSLNRATERHCRVYERWSAGGAGLLLTGNIMVDARFLERPGNVVLEDELGFEELRRYARAATSGGNHCWVQLSHPGRQCQRVIAARPLAPSEAEAVKVLGAFGKPRAMTTDEIRDAIRRFARSAELAKKAGFTGLQIHSAHGYLSSQFLSPLTNRRTDEWGGSIENRARFLLSILRETRKRVGPDFPVSVKLNSADFQRGGFTEEDSMRVIEMLNDESVDLLEISGGNYEAAAMVLGPEDTRAESTRRREAYFLDYAKQVRDLARMPLMLTGGLRSRAAMEDAIESGAIDVIGLGRPLAVEPDLPRRLISGESDSSIIEPIHSINKTITGLVELGFYARNIARMGDGLQPEWDLHKLASGAQYMLGDFAAAFRWRLARSRARQLKTATATT